MSVFALVVSYDTLYTPTLFNWPPQPILVIWFNAEHMFVVLRQDPEVARLACVYLKYASLGLPAYTFNLISRSVLFIVFSFQPSH